MPKRGELTSFIDRHLLAWEVGMGVLAAVYLAVSFLLDTDAAVVTGIVVGLSIIFVLEFTLRLLDAPSRRRYLRSHWLDLISAVPFIGGLRSFRLLRLLRLGAGFRVMAAAEHVGTARESEHDLWFIVPTLLFTWFAAAAAYFVSEVGSNPKVHDFGDALYWAFTTATTLGYGASAPVTAAGRIVSGFVIFAGVGIVGFASARLAQFWLRDESRHHPRLMIEKLEHLEREMDEIKQLLEQRSPGAGPVSPPSRPTAAAPREAAEAGARRRSR